MTFGFTAGYMGWYWWGGYPYYGTGYYYDPWVWYDPFYPYAYPYYYPYAYSYGVGAWYNRTTGMYGRGVSYYGPYGGFGRGAAYNPTTGTYARGAVAWGPGGTAAAATAYNPRTGAWGGTVQGANPYGRWGSSVVTRGDDWARTGSIGTAQGNLAGVRTSTGAAGIAGRGGQGGFGAVRTAGGDVYVGRDGNVYRRQGDQWQQRGESGWNNTSGPTGANLSPEARDRLQGARGELSNRNVSRGDVFGDLNRNRQSRSVGNQRLSDFRSRGSGGLSRRGGGLLRRR